jgi:hypothetical protein
MSRAARARDELLEKEPTRMHAALIEAAAAVAPFADPLPGAQSPSWLKIGAIIGAIVAFAGIVLMIFGLTLTARAKKGDMKGAAKASGVAGIGLFWIVVGATGIGFGIISTTVAFVVNS